MVPRRVGLTPGLGFGLRWGDPLERAWGSEWLSGVLAPLVFVHGLGHVLLARSLENNIVAIRPKGMCRAVRLRLQKLRVEVFPVLLWGCGAQHLQAGVLSTATSRIIRIARVMMHARCLAGRHWLLVGRALPWRSAAGLRCLPLLAGRHLGVLARRRRGRPRRRWEDPWVWAAGIGLWAWGVSTTSCLGWGARPGDNGSAAHVAEVASRSSRRAQAEGVRLRRATACAQPIVRRPCAVSPVAAGRRGSGGHTDTEARAP